MRKTILCSLILLFSVSMINPVEKSDVSDCPYPPGSILCGEGSGPGKPIGPDED